MNPVEAIFQFIAELTIKIAKKFNISDVVQYRLLIALRVSVASFIPIVGLFATIYPNEFNLRPDLITILALASTCIIFFYLIAQQYQIVFSSNKEILKLLNTKSINNFDIDPKEYLSSRRMQMCIWAIIGFICASTLWLHYTNLQLLFAAMMIPALFDYCFVILIVSWELSRHTTATLEKTTKPASE